jgi:hypothetical protein
MLERLQPRLIVPEGNSYRLIPADFSPASASGYQKTFGDQ